MVLQLARATIDDVEALAECGRLAFENDKLNNLLLPPTPAVQQWRIDRIKSRINSPHFHAWKVTDSERDDLVVALAGWIGAVPPEVLDEINAEASQLSLPEGADEELANSFYGQVKEKKKKFAEEHPRFWYLASLATRPDYQRRGCAAMLLQWGLDQAGKDGTVVYLEASEAGLPFYYRYGAQEVDFIETLGGQCRHACLVIHPKKMNAEGS